MQEKERRGRRIRRCRTSGMEGKGGWDLLGEGAEKNGNGMWVNGKDRRAGRRRVEGIHKKGKSVRRVGTGRVGGGRMGGLRKRRRKRSEDTLQSKESKRERQRETPKKVGGKRSKSTKRGREVARGKVVRVEREWVSGRLTNHKEYVKYVKRYAEKQKQKKALEGEGESKKTKGERWYEKHRKGRENWLEEEVDRPGVVVFRNTVDQEAGRKEARMCGVPTVGRVTDDRSPERKQIRTYGRPWQSGEKGVLIIGQRMLERLAPKTK